MDVRVEEVRVEEVRVEEVRVLHLIVPSDDVCHLRNVSQDESRPGPELHTDHHQGR